MNRLSGREIGMALSGAGDPMTRLEALSRVVVDLLVEVEALRTAVAELSGGPAGKPGTDRYDGPCHDESLVEDKPAYAAAYVNSAYALHNSAGPSGGIDKIVGRFYPANGSGPREPLMLRRLGYSEAAVARFLQAAEHAELFS